MNIWIIDDHELMSDGIRDCILRVSPDCNVTTFANAELVTKALDGQAKSWPDIVFLDLFLGAATPNPTASSSFGLLEQLVTHANGLARPRVYIVSAEDTQAFATQSAEGGASGFIGKRYLTRTNLPSLIALVMANVTLYTVAPASGVLWDVEKSLTGTERKMLSMLKHGKTAKEVAKAIDKSPNTVANYMSKLRARTGMEDHQLFSLVR